MSDGSRLYNAAGAAILFRPPAEGELCKGCTACQKICPSDLELPEKGSWNGNGDCFQCQKCLEICPKKNAESGFRFFRGNEIWFAVLRAVILAAVLILAGI